jgi:Ran GTPase-activating protein (RanGAP) involved in mRNA processing and transport
LSSNNIGDEGCQTIAPALRTMPNLKILGLSSNNIGDNSIAILSSVLPDLPSLEVLSLYDNKFGNVGCQCLLELVESSSLQSLTCLELEGNFNISSSELKDKFKRVWREKGNDTNKLYF